jgi:hypothetical protein
MQALLIYVCVCVWIYVGLFVFFIVYKYIINYLLRKYVCVEKNINEIVLQCNE